eukprot:9450501-Alexandrium_andersonii.AAC.1
MSTIEAVCMLPRSHLRRRMLMLSGPVAFVPVVVAALWAVAKATNKCWQRMGTSISRMPNWSAPPPTPICARAAHNWL